jgi:hypothetical protein
MFAFVGVGAVILSQMNMHRFDSQSGKLGNKYSGQEAGAKPKSTETLAKDLLGGSSRMVSFDFFVFFFLLPVLSFRLPLLLSLVLLCLCRSGYRSSAL